MSNTAITDETALLIVSCAAAIHQQLYLVIDLLNEQARVLKRLIGKRIRPTNDERRRLAALAHKLDRRILEAQELIVTVDTFQRWHRRLIAATYSAKRTGRPRLDAKTEALIAAHWPHLAAIDFATFEVPQGNRTHRYHALYAIKVATREAHIVGVTDQADGAWMLNMARALTDPDSGYLRNIKTVIMDLDPLFTTQVRACFASIGCKPKVLPPRSPNLNAYIERFIGTVRREVGRRIIPLSGDHLRAVLREHIAYYNHERNHRGLPASAIPVPIYDRDLNTSHAVKCRSRLGKTLNYYYREAV